MCEGSLLNGQLTETETHHMAQSWMRGFTLIELSIVLVIIGLITGGVIAGQELIKAAAARATIAQIEKYQTAVNTFYGKYNALPGDISSTDANTFGFVSRNGARGRGDGNGVIEGWDGNVGIYSYSLVESGGETALLWRDLAKAGLVDGGFNTATDDGAQSDPGSYAQLSLFVPRAKLGSDDYVFIFSNQGGGLAVGNVNNGTNFFEIEGINNTGAICSQAGDALAGSGQNAGEVCTGTSNIPNTMAYNIDKKMDDGLPTSGSVLAQVIGNNVFWATDGSGAGIGVAVSPSGTTCMDNGGSTANPWKYTQSNTGSCGLSIKFQ